MNEGSGASTHSYNIHANKMKGKKVGKRPKEVTQKNKVK